MGYIELRIKMDFSTQDKDRFYFELLQSQRPLLDFELVGVQRLVDAAGEPGVLEGR
jgi:hypothetical protein